MMTETQTTIREHDIGPEADELCVIVRHDESYEYTFDVKFGCMQRYLTIVDLQLIVKVANKALRIAKAAHK